MPAERRTIHALLVAAGAHAGEDDDLLACLDATPSPLLVADRAGLVAWLNPAMGELLGRAPADCVDRPMAGTILEEDVFRDMWRHLGAGDVIARRATRLRTPAGWREVVLSARPARDGERALAGARFCVRSPPPTRAHRTSLEQALRVIEDRFRGLVEVTGQIVWTTDPTGRALEDSPSWRRFTGQTFEEMYGWGWVAALAPEQQREIVSLWTAGVAAREPLTCDYRLRRADGTYADMLVRAVPLLNRDGSVREWIGVSIDVSAQRATEQQREALVADLRRAMRDQDMFVGVLGHDLRSPLSAVLMATSLGLRRCTDERTRRVLQQIGSSGRRMLRMIEQLLDVTRIRAAGGLEIRRTRADLAMICRTIIDELQQAYPGARVVLERRGSTLGAWDVDRVSQMASNLIGNALQHAEGRRVATVLVDGRDPERVSFAVKNRGAIAPELLGSIFDPFRRAAGGPVRTDGLGLGLYITQQIAIAHGGAVSVVSDPARGTTFRVDLPREAASSVGAPTGASDAAPLMRGDAA